MADALGEAREKRRIYRQRDSGWHSIVKSIDRGLGEVDIALTTIDGFCSENAIASIDLLKSDTEGFDLAVLRGAREMLLQGRIKAIYSEVGFYPNDLGHTNFCELLAYLQASQFQLFNVYSVCSTYIEGLDFPWTNALFIRNDLIDAISRPAYLQWRRENG